MVSTGRWTCWILGCALLLGAAGCDEPTPPELTVVEASEDTPHDDLPNDTSGQATDEAREQPVEETAAALKIPPQDDVRMMQAWGLIAQRQYERAEVILAEVLVEYPDASQAEFFLGVSYQKQKDYERARRQFERVIASGVPFERDEVVFYFYGWGLYWLGQLEASREAFETFKESTPQEADVWFALGLIDYDEDKLDAAEANFKHALSLHEAMALENSQRYRSRLQAVAKCHGRLADVYIRREQLDSARDSLRTAIELWPRNHQPYYKLYRVLTRLGDEAGAERALATHQRRLREQGIVEGDG